MDAQIFFSLGIIAQLVFTIGGKFKKEYLKKILIDIGLAALFTGYVFIRNMDGAGSILIIFILALSFLLALTFREQVLPEINEIVLIVWNVGFWYLFLIGFGLWNYLSLILFVPTLCSLIVGVFKVNVNKLTKILLYLWFLVMGVAISIMLSPLNEAMASASDRPMSLAQSFFLGMIFFYAFSYLLYIFYFIPIPGRHQSIYERTKQIKEHARLIASKYNDVQFHSFVMISMLLVVSAGMVINYSFDFINEGLLLTIVLGLSPIIGEKFDKIIHVKFLRS